MEALPSSPPDADGNKRPGRCGKRIMYPQSYIRVVRLGNCAAPPSSSVPSWSHSLSITFLVLSSSLLRWNRFFARGNIRYLDTAKGDHWREESAVAVKSLHAFLPSN